MPEPSKDACFEHDARLACVQAMRRFTRQHNLPDDCWTEQDEGHRVVFIGTTPDGRQFGISYVRKTD